MDVALVRKSFSESPACFCHICNKHPQCPCTTSRTGDTTYPYQGFLCKPKDTYLPLNSPLRPNYHPYTAQQSKCAPSHHRAQQPSPTTLMICAGPVLHSNRVYTYHQQYVQLLRFSDWLLARTTGNSFLCFLPNHNRHAYTVYLAKPELLYNHPPLP